MVAISAELQAIIDEELAKEPAPPAPSAARWDQVSTELWRLIDEEQRPLLPGGAAGSPLYVVPPLPPDLAAAADAAGQARRRVEAKIEALHRHRAARAPNCGKGRAIHLRRDREGGGVEDALVRTSCGRSDCPHCRRRRVTRCLRRAAGCLLEADGSALPRVGPLYVAEVDWSCWEASDRALRRAVGNCGRLRVRRDDNRVLVVSAMPFRGARAVPPAEAVGLVCAAIDRLHTARHSYRQLGEWTDRRVPRWRLVERHGGAIDFAAVREQLHTLGVRSRQLKAPGLAALLWRADTEAEADRLTRLLLAAGVSDFDHRGNLSSHGPKSDSSAGDGFCTFDPEDNPWANTGGGGCPAGGTVTRASA